ncbi:MAG TPA: hypothetical protein VIB62_03130 [Actinomycetota bacterium]|jgi:hypothetical protein
MPRKNRRNPFDHEPFAAPRPRSAAPTWAEAPGFEIRQVAGDKPYRCPGCDHVVRPGSWHLVVIPDREPDERRHWHLECWRSELRRSGLLRGPEHA